MSDEAELQSQFPSTHWSLVALAGGRDANEAQREALAQLLRQYLPAIRYYLITVWRMNRDAADDLLQSFITDKVLADGLIGRADEGRGQFRHFLMTSLDRFTSNSIRYRQAQKRAPMRQSSLDDVAPAAARHADEPTVIFDVAWAQGVLEQALEEMRCQCVATARAHLWGIFEARVLRPARENVDPVAYEQLVSEYDFVSPTQASNALVTATRMFRRILREMVGRYVKDEREIDEEILDLRRVLARAGAGSSHRPCI